MPILRGAVTFSRLRAEPLGKSSSDQAQWLARGLRLRAFHPIDRSGDQDRSAGFVALEDNDSVDFEPGDFLQGDYLLVTWRVDQLKIPSATLRAELEKWRQAFEKDNARPPGRVERAEARLAIRQELRNHTNPSTRTVDVSWNLSTHEAQVWTVSRSMLDEVVDGLEKAFGVKLTPLVPPTVADSLQIPDKALEPTPELSWPGFKEGRDGQA
jgi:DNA recombination-dependent growth factor C